MFSVSAAADTAAAEPAASHLLGRGTDSERGSPYAPAAANTAAAEPAATALILPFYEGQSQVLFVVL